MRDSRTRTRLTAVAALLCLPWTAASCGDRPAPGPDPAPSSDTTSEPTEATPPTDDSIDNTPATGLELAEPEVASIHVPEGGWKAADAFVDGEHTAAGRDGLITLFTSRIAAPDGLDTLAKTAAQAPLWESKPRRLEDVTLDGVGFYVLTGTQVGDDVTTYGGFVGADSVTLTFALDPDLPAERKQAIIDTTIASFTAG